MQVCFWLFPMRSVIPLLFTIAFTAFLATASHGQVDQICAEAGYTPSLDSPFAQVPYVFGRVRLKNSRAGSKLPRIVVSVADSKDRADRLALGDSGNYCFKRRGSGGTLLVEVDGVEVARRTLAPFGAAQQREDFEIEVGSERSPAVPGTLSAKFSHPRNEKTEDLYKQAAEAEKNRDLKSAADLLFKVVSFDPKDFIAWAKLGTIYFEMERYDEAEAALRKSIQLKPEYTAAWINAGKLRVARKQPEAAIEVFKHVVEVEPTNARAFQLLGEAYIQTKQGSLGANALKEALRLDPIGMAECHLLLGRLYDLAGAKEMASKEFSQFLQKVPDYPEKKKLESYIKSNPPKS